MQTTLKFYNQSVGIQTRDDRLIKKIEQFLDQYYTVNQKGFGANSEASLSKIYASVVSDHNTVVIHRNQFTHFLHWLQLRNEVLENYRTEDHRVYEVTKEDYVIRPKWKLREDQKPVNEFLKDNPTKSKLVPLATGSGKTLIALYTLGELKDRIGIVVLPQFIDKWISDILEIHDADGKEVMLIQGSKSLAGIIAMGKEGKVSNKYFLFSSRTMQDFISMYEQTPDQCVEMYGASPLEVFPLLGIGVLLIDETHMAFHAIFKTIINTNVKYQIGLSGTLISEDVVVSRVHRVVYPKSSTYHDTMQKRYMDIYAIAYGINPILIQTKRIKTVNYGSTFYSHIAFEKSVLKDKRFMSDYYRIIKGVIEDYYIPDYDKRDSLIIYVATINMADTVLGMLKRDYPGKDIVRYCEVDDYDTMLKAEIVVTTPQSLSTGIDKPNLRVVIQTVSISSEVTNVQSAGRLRDLKDRDTKFCYIYSDNIQKQREYHKKREQMFAHRCKTFSLRRSRFSIS